MSEWVLIIASNSFLSKLHNKVCRVVKALLGGRAAAVVGLSVWLIRIIIVNVTNNHL